MSGYYGTKNYLRKGGLYFENAMNNYVPTS